MKKIVVLSAVAVLLSACISTNGSENGSANLGSIMVRSYVQNRCVNELQNRDEWRLAALAMSRAKQQEWENKICGCASEEAPNQLTAADMSKLLSENGRTQVAAEVTVRTVNTCMNRLFKKQ